MQQRVKNLLPLLDADILVHECALFGQIRNEDKSIEILPFYLVKDAIEDRVKEIMEALDTILEPIMYLSGPTNFRDEVAKRKVYKGNRDPNDKPYHIKNARVYIEARFNTYTSVGCEADDLVCISQMEDLRKKGVNFSKEKANTVVCTRDKDLRQCMGWHYGWEVGNQPEYRLKWVDEIGDLTPTFSNKTLKNGEPSQALKKLEGTGLKWFYAQLLIGDAVDNIPGVPNYGPSKAYNLLNGLEKEEDMLEACINIYKEKYDECWVAELTEQAHLVYMLRERNVDGSLKFWEMPYRSD